MENLQKLAEEKAIEAYPTIGEELNYHNILMGAKRELYIKGFLDHAQLAAEDKKELLEANKWIDCNDRLPEVEGDYLVIRNNKIEIERLIKSKKGELYRWDYIGITHWQPLPSNPKEL